MAIRGEQHAEEVTGSDSGTFQQGHQSGSGAGEGTQANRYDSNSYLCGDLGCGRLGRHREFWKWYISVAEDLSGIANRHPVTRHVWTGIFDT